MIFPRHLIFVSSSACLIPRDPLSSLSDTCSSTFLQKQTLQLTKRGLLSETVVFEIHVETNTIMAFFFYFNSPFVTTRLQCDTTIIILYKSFLHSNNDSIQTSES